LKHKFLFSVFVIFFICVFIALGSWQIIRLNWKNNLILEIESSLKNPPVELSKSNMENYLKIKTNGTIDFVHGSKSFLSDSLFNHNPKVGDMILFPNNLMHTAYPFKREGERRSFSFNVDIDKKTLDIFNG
jgi:cytochrome oxidase assembly protein ShyY1